MKKTARILASALVFGLVSVAAFAAEPGGPEGGQGGPPGGVHPGGPREACREDAQNFCKGVQPGGGRILDCLKDHYKEISDPCYNALQNMPTGKGGHQPPPPLQEGPQGEPPEQSPGK